jgi:hypothetical protein
MIDQNKLKMLKPLSSLKLTVVCLVILTALVFWGTVYQAEHGLYQAQQKFFHSWVFFIFGFIPFPGTVLVMFVLFINLVFSLIFRIGFRWPNLGNVITHLGIIILLVGGFLTFYFSEESALSLREGERSNWSTSRHLWEIAVWEETGAEKDVYAVDTARIDAGEGLRFDELGIVVNVTEVYSNCIAMTGGQGMGEKPVLNASGIRAINERPDAMEAGENVAGMVVDVQPLSSEGGQGPRVLLYGHDKAPTAASANDRHYGFSLRRKKLPLPIEVFLKDFRVKLYPNSNIVKSYESTVRITAEGGLDRDVVISMNKPMREGGYTFFQSSYYIAPDGTQYSIFAVVKNTGRLLPYFSSITIFTGMLIHFLVMMFRRRKKGKAPGDPDGGTQEKTGESES